MNISTPRPHYTKHTCIAPGGRECESAVLGPRVASPSQSEVRRWGGSGSEVMRSGGRRGGVRRRGRGGGTWSPRRCCCTGWPRGWSSRRSATGTLLLQQRERVRSAVLREYKVHSNFAIQVSKHMGELWRLGCVCAWIGVRHWLWSRHTTIRHLYTTIKHTASKGITPESNASSKGSENIFLGIIQCQEA